MDETELVLFALDELTRVEVEIVRVEVPEHTGIAPPPPGLRQGIGTDTDTHTDTATAQRRYRTYRHGDSGAT